MNYFKRIYLLVALTIFSLVPVLAHAQDISTNNTNVNFNTSGGEVVSGYLNNTNLYFTVSGSIEAYENYDHADILINDALLGSVSVDKLEFAFTRDVSSEAKRQELIDAGLLDEGENEISLMIYDDLGDLIIDPPNSATFIADFQSPTIDVAAKDTSATNYIKVGDEIIFTLSSDEKLNLDSIAAEFNDRDLNWVETGLPSSYEYKAIYEVEEGDQDISSPVELFVEARDLAGNQTSETFEDVLDGKSIDANSPKLVISSPTQVQYLADNKVKVDYLVSDDVSQEVIRINNEEVVLSDGYIELGDGSYILEITVTDMAGNSTSEEVGFTVDTTKPLVSYLGDSNMSISPGDDLVIRGKTEPNTEVQLEIHSKVIKYSTISDDKGNWSIKVDTSELNPGDHELFIIVVDEAGNQTYRKIANLSVVEPVIEEAPPARVAKVEPVVQVDDGNVVADVAPVTYSAPRSKTSISTDNEDQKEEVAQAGKILSSEDVREEGINWTVWLIVFGLVALSSLVAAISYYGYGQVIEAKEKAGSDSSGDIETTVRKVANEGSEKVKEESDDLDEYVRW